MTIDEALTQGARTLDKAGIESARAEVRMILRFVLGISLEQLLMNGDAPVDDAQLERFNTLVALRASRQPMAQVLGVREFWGLEFKVTPATLDPRPDSETLIAELLQYKKNRGQEMRILDLGTGTGCLLLSALSEYPRSSGLGVDLSPEALDVAAHNARVLGLEKRAEFKKSDWNSQINGVWDVVLSNPPYIPTEEIPQLAPEVAQHEPRLALDGGRDGLDCYRTITRFLPNILAEGGVALLEVGAKQARDVAELGEKQGLNIAHIARDLAGVERCIVMTKSTT